MYRRGCLEGSEGGGWEAKNLLEGDKWAGRSVVMRYNEGRTVA